MRKIALSVLLLCIIAVACTKSVKQPLSYNVEVKDQVYITQTGSFIIPVTAKFYTGNLIDSVMVRISGLPANATVTPDSFTAIPTFTQPFTVTTNGAPLGDFPITVTSYSPTTGYTSQTFVLHIIPVDCASTLIGNLRGENDCRANYPYPATGLASGATNVLQIANLGGYGPDTRTTVVLNCMHDSLYIERQNIGNGVTLQGYGTFTANQMIIWYTTPATPNGYADTCKATLTRY